MFWAELLVVLAMLVIGARYGGIFLGMSSGAAIAILVFGFGLAPGNPAIDVIMIIMTVVVIASTLQASGGMDYLIQIAVQLLRRNPNRISYYAPIISWVFTFMCGTGNIAFGILPVIAEVAREAGVRPERPISMSVIASQQAITACPISAATVALVGLLSPAGVTLIDILLVCIPSTLIGVLFGCLYSSRMGKDLSEDSEYIARVAAGDAAPVNEAAQIAEAKEFDPSVKRSVWLYLLATVIVVIFGIFPELRPSAAMGGKMVPFTMTMCIEMVMMLMAGVIVIACKVKVASIIEQSVFRNGLMGVYCIFGLTWAGDTLTRNNIDFIKSGAADIIAAHPWVFALILFFLSAVILSQAGTIGALAPLGITLGIAPGAMVGMFPAVNGYFLVPIYATILAGIAFDRTGTTRIGRFVFNHSFQIPGLITCIVSVAVGMTLGNIIL
ncbi:anaerobic C4-dicarboxylate transporter [Selenomonas sp. TAMA-11512]|uniref:anaerobic C4-dicarboxylate transporter n=1 Tax=Selenomonas sp. TAMA-11512 TaxID=3095337 RepID=UPI0030875ADA|nr:anaerobic C4-dicarboxylate transporter [Selenomonas sp. TAMA-11512]